MTRSTLLIMALAGLPIAPIVSGDVSGFGWILVFAFYWTATLVWVLRWTYPNGMPTRPATTRRHSRPVADEEDDEDDDERSFASKCYPGSPYIEADIMGWND